MDSVPIALLIRAGARRSSGARSAVPGRTYPGLAWSGFVTGDPTPVTLGNVVDGGVLVGAARWCVYLRRR